MRPGVNLAVDEAMVQFSRTDSNIVTIPPKFTTTRFKIWALAYNDQIHYWLSQCCRKRPVRMNKQQGGVVFGEGNSEVFLAIPKLIDPHRYFMDGVDRFNQIRTY